MLVDDMKRLYRMKAAVHARSSSSVFAHIISQLYFPAGRPPPTGNTLFNRNTRAAVEQAGTACKMGQQ